MEITSLRDPTRLVVNHHNFGTIANLYPTLIDVFLEKAVVAENRYNAFVWNHMGKGYAQQEAILATVDGSALLIAIRDWRENPSVENGDRIASLLSAERRYMYFRRLERSFAALSNSL